jgi:hypothetical protein
MAVAAGEEGERLGDARGGLLQPVALEILAEFAKQFADQFFNAFLVHDSFIAN